MGASATHDNPARNSERASSLNHSALALQTPRLALGSLEVDGGDAWVVHLRNVLEEPHRDAERPHDRQHNADPLPPLRRNPRIGGRVARLLKWRQPPASVHGGPSSLCLAQSVGC
jgi:hypothetical protein